MTEKGKATTLLILVVLIIIAAVGLVAANNRAASYDAGEAMIRRHYAARILDHTDQITRKSLPSLGPLAQLASDNVFADPSARRVDHRLSPLRRQ